VLPWYVLTMELIPIPVKGVGVAELGVAVVVAVEVGSGVGAGRDGYSLVCGMICLVREGLDQESS